MAARAVVVANGDPGGSAAWGRELLSRAALVVAADGGAATALRWGRTPDVLVGDLDSLSPRIRRRLEASGCEVITHAPEKDHTDAELALLEAWRRGIPAIEIVGAFGGVRLDHALGNVFLLALPQIREARVALVDERHVVRLLRGPGRLEIRGSAGDFVTLLPLSATASGVATEGMKYALAGETLSRGSSRGVSNELTRVRGSVELRRGQLLVVHHRVHARPPGARHPAREAS